MEGREWADAAAEALARGEPVQVRPRGHSMRGLIKDGELITLVPCETDALAVGDIVVARVRGWLLVLHQIVAREADRFRIGTPGRKADGWVSANEILGRVASGHSAASK